MSDEPEFSMTKRMFGAFCPDCGGLAGNVVTLANDQNLRCNDCNKVWRPSEIENCVMCDKPLGSSDAVCHTCWTAFQEGDLDPGFSGVSDES